ncbi:hypothetical protein [Carboxylicivirga linearis]|uniref:Hsp20/alpha crystallin family protein n=1 Tax=Carboxylicivirga linearis TaxID=1628157 RepID=A0ABS5JZW4_9BACT|nr:hypothetical protein [Carboxylicivirga linearis]MBS2100408.1 hypothetical protein [Carboxylicivirga linearis]
MTTSENKNDWDQLLIKLNDITIPAESDEYSEFIPHKGITKEDDILVFELTPIEMSMLNRNINLKYVERSSFICESCKDDLYSFKLGDFEMKIQLPPELDVKVGRNYKLDFILEEAAD